MKFNYSMENVLSIKEKMEEQKKMELGQAQSILDSEKKRLKFYHKKETDTISLFKNTISNSINSKKLQNMYKSMKYYDEKIKDQENNVSIAQNNLNNKREQLIHAMIERKMHEKLKEKAYMSFVKEETIKEQQVIDEVVCFKYNA